MAKLPPKPFRACLIVAFCGMLAYIILVGTALQAAEWVNVGGTHKFDRKNVPLYDPPGFLSLLPIPYMFLPRPARILLLHPLLC